MARRPKARTAARRPLPTLDVLALALQAAALPAGQQGLLFPEFAYALKQQQARQSSALLCSKGCLLLPEVPHVLL